MRKKYKLLSVILSLTISAACFASFNFSACADEVSDGFIYRIEENKAILCGLDKSVSGDVTVPDKLGGYDVVMIDRAFKNKTGIGSVFLPDTVTVITTDSFFNCSLRSIRLPNNLLRIGEAAFYACVNLVSVEMPDSLTNLGKYAFSWCESLERVVFSNGLTFIDEEIFNGCSKLNEINLPDSIKYVASAAFSNTGYTNNAANWENGVLYLGQHIIAAKTVLSGRYAVKAGTKSISDFSFLRCTELSEIFLPADLKIIGKSAFSFCDNLKRVIYEKSEDQIRTISIDKNNTPIVNAEWYCDCAPDAVLCPAGDINGDFDVDNRDISCFFRYLSGWDEEVQPSVIDVNGDSKVNNKDLIRLFQYLSGWSVDICSEYVASNYPVGDYGPIISF